MIIQIRGTGGSGKSTLVKRVMNEYTNRSPHYIEKRKRPFYYTLNKGDRRLLVPGHYEIPTGGCDTLKTPDQVYDLVTMATKEGFDVLYEGIIIMDDVRRAVETSKKFPPYLTIALTTPIAECIAGIEARQAAKGVDRKWNPRKTVARDERHKRHLFRLKDAGVQIERLDREAAFLRIKELFQV